MDSMFCRRKSPLQKLDGAANSCKDLNDVGENHQAFSNVDNRNASVRMLQTRQQSYEAPGARTNEGSQAQRKVSSCSTSSHASTRSINSLTSLESEKRHLLSTSDQGSSDMTLCSRVRSLHCHSLPAMTTQPRAPEHSGPASLSGPVDQKTLVRQTAIADPDAIVWADVQKRVVARNKEGKLGFGVLDVEVSSGRELMQMYAI